MLYGPDKKIRINLILRHSLANRLEANKLGRHARKSFRLRLEIGGRHPPEVDKCLRSSEVVSLLDGTAWARTLTGMRLGLLVPAGRALVQIVRFYTDKLILRSKFPKRPSFLSKSNRGSTFTTITRGARSSIEFSR